VTEGWGSPPQGQWPPPPPPPGWGQYPPQYPPPVAPQRTEPLSTWSLILGILSFFVCWVIGGIAAIITGSRAKKAIDASGGAKTGRSAAVAGQVLGWSNIGLSVVVGILAAVIAVFASHHQSYTSLHQGDCFNRSGGIFSALVSKVSCDKPHQDEVVGRFDAPDSSWPGASGIQAIAQPQCSTLVEQYVTPPPQGVVVGWIYPGHRSWDSGTRTVVCTVRNADGSKRRGSLRGGVGPTTTG
jgi:hypothetical protein